MNKILEKWEIISASSGIVRFLDINLRSIGQVMFQDNPLTGLLFLAAIAWGSYAAGVPRVAIAGVLAVVVANLTAQWLNADSELAPFRALWIQRHPRRTCIGDISVSERAHVGLCGVGGISFSHCDAWDCQRRQALGCI